MDKIIFDQYVQHAKDAFKALGLKSDPIDAIGSLTESDFPTNGVRKLDQSIKEETRAYIKFLEGVSSDIDELKAFSASIKLKVEEGTANKDDIAMLEEKLNELIKVQVERDDEEANAYSTILERLSSEIDELRSSSAAIKQNVEGHTASKEDIAILEQKISELTTAQEARDAQVDNSGNVKSTFQEYFDQQQI